MDLRLRANAPNLRSQQYGGPNDDIARYRYRFNWTQLDVQNVTVAVPASYVYTPSAQADYDDDDNYDYDGADENADPDKAYAPDAALHGMGVISPDSPDYLDLTDPRVRLSDTNSVMLVVRGDQLQPGVTYAFKFDLEVYDLLDGGELVQVGSVTVPVRVVEPPFSTAPYPLWVSSNATRAVDYLTRITALGWTGPNYPFRYVFKYILTQGSTTGVNSMNSNNPNPVELPLSESTDEPYVDAYLPPGVLAIVCYVYNSLGGATRVVLPGVVSQLGLTPVVVTPYPGEGTSIPLPPLSDGAQPLGVDVDALLAMLDESVLAQQYVLSFQLIQYIIDIVYGVCAGFKIAFSSFFAVATASSSVVLCSPAFVVDRANLATVRGRLVDVVHDIIQRLAFNVEFGSCVGTALTRLSLYDVLGAFVTVDEADLSGTGGLSALPAGSVLALLQEMRTLYKQLVEPLDGTRWEKELGILDWLISGMINVCRRVIPSNWDSQRDFQGSVPGIDMPPYLTSEPIDVGAGTASTIDLIDPVYNDVSAGLDAMMLEQLANRDCTRFQELRGRVTAAIGTRLTGRLPDERLPAPPVRGRAGSDGMEMGMGMMGEDMGVTGPPAPEVELPPVRRSFAYTTTAGRIPVIPQDFGVPETSLTTSLEVQAGAPANGISLSAVTGTADTDPTVVVASTAPTEIDIPTGSVDFVSQLLSQFADAEFADVYTVRLNAQTTRFCFPANGTAFSATNDTAGDTPGSDIIDITVVNSGDGGDGQPLANITNLNYPVSFCLNHNQITGSCVAPSTDLAVCKWFDTTSQTWRQDGCVTTQPLVPGGCVTCACNHLTEFALLIRPYSTQCGQAYLSFEQRVVYTFFASVFTTVSVVSAIQLVRIVMLSMAKTSKSAAGIRSLVLQHVLVLCSGVLRASLLFVRAQPDVLLATPLSVVAVWTALPYLFMFLAFTSLIFQWAGIVHFSMKAANPADKVKVPLWITNLILWALLAIAVLGLLSATDDDLKLNIVKYASILMAVLCILFAVGLLGYGFSIIRTLNSTTSSQAGTAAARMTKGTLLFALCFLAEAVLWLATAVDIDAFYGSEYIYSSIFYVFSALSLMAILWLFGNGVTALAKDKKTKDLESSPSHRTMGRQTTGLASRSDESRTNSPKSGTSHGRARDNTQDATELTSTTGMSHSPTVQRAASETSQTSSTFAKSNTAKRLAKSNAAGDEELGLADERVEASRTVNSTTVNTTTKSATHRREASDSESPSALVRGTGSAVGGVGTPAAGAGAGAGGALSTKPGSKAHSREDEEAPQAHCDECETKLASLKCDECSQKLCQECSDTLHRAGKRVQHVVHAL